MDGRAGYPALEWEEMDVPAGFVMEDVRSDDEFAVSTVRRYWRTGLDAPGGEPDSTRDVSSDIRFVESDENGRYFRWWVSYRRPDGGHGVDWGDTDSLDEAKSMAEDSVRSRYAELSAGRGGGHGR